MKRSMNYRSSDRRKQGGGTILGIIIGLIIGLSIAVVVAVTINKTPIPFVDRGVKADRGPNSQLPDLNRSLYGDRESAKRVAQEFQKEPAAVTAAPAANQEAANQPQKPQTEAGKPADSVEWAYYLQAGAFREQSDAENAKAKLALMGIESTISERSSENGTLHRVRVGPFAQVEPMNRMRARLSENGVDVAVVRIPK